MDKGYDPSAVEEKWYQYWIDNQFFRASATSKKEPFCIVIPPPNVTGSLHMGHALNNTLQDVLCRYKRMKGFNVLWQPGTDHAGIATQNVVEKALSDEGTSRHEVGREHFTKRVWEWRAQYGGIIINQLKRLGSSCDWSRERFTMDEGLSRAVREVFVQLYEEDLIYRGDYIINWCPRCHTALADLEVEHEDLDSKLYYIRYPLEKGNGYVTVGTTRPETLLGDSAIAVNPEDERYKSLSGLNVLLPILNRSIPIIFDPYVDMDFGTGALKITPAHDPHDFDIGNAHNLERIKVIDENGQMNSLAGPYEGMDRFACREMILKDLEKAGLLEKIEPLRHAVGHCYRCKTMIEPILSKQWFVKVAPLAEKALQAVKDGKTKIVPTSWENVYYDWMHNIRDWCISRQIWWGHRIPAWYCDDCGEVLVAKEAPSACTACEGKRLSQETDVLDTWFSSALWPFSTLGWPDRTDELKTFYPTSVLITGFDILFFWVARMMMMGLHFMGDVPFSDVYIHALVRDSEGSKMSKSKGNVIDPLVVLEEFGTDAFRFTLCAFAAQGRDVKLSEARIEGYRHFVNKIWNSARLVLLNLSGYPKNLGPDEKASLDLPGQWILTKLGQVADGVGKALEDYRFNDAASICYQFVWHEFCDWYLEMAKPGLYGDDEAVKQRTMSLLQEILMGVLKMTHPFMPFVTEDIWQRLPGAKGSIMVAPFPESSKYPLDTERITEMELLMGVITAVRNIRGEMSLAPSKKLSILIEGPKGAAESVIRDNRIHIENMAGVKEIQIEAASPKPEGCATAVVGDFQVHVQLKGLIDFEEEKKRLRKEIQKIDKDMAGSTKKLSNQNFLEKAPEEIVAGVKEKVEALELKRERLKKNLLIFEITHD